ncbi:MAG: serine protease [Myxococcota bacterium]
MSLMSLSSLITDNIWLQCALVGIAMIVVPLVVLDRLMPSDVREAQGLPSTVFAFSWALVPALALGIALGPMSPLIRAEAELLEPTALAPVAEAMRAIAVGDDGAAPEAEPEPESAPSAVTPIAMERSSDATRDHVGGTSSPSPAQPDANADVTPGPPEVAAERDRETVAMTPAELFVARAASVVAIKVVYGGHEAGGGTGFIVDGDRVVTNFHVVEPALRADHGARHRSRRLAVHFHGGDWAPEVSLIDIDESRDLALLSLDVPEGYDAVVLAGDDAIEVGEPAISIGSPLGLDYSLTEGVVSARRMHEGHRWIQVSTPLSPGNSGGPIFTTDGDVIGVSTRASGGYLAQNINLAIPSSDVVTMLEREPTLEQPINMGGGTVQGSGTW